MPESATNRWTHPDVTLVATDLSDLDRLLPFALEQAANTATRLVLLHVVSAGKTMSTDALGMPYYDPSSAIDSAASTLETWCEMARSHQVVCDAIIREGHAAQEVIAAARQIHADRILLGTRSRGKVSKLLLGSVAEQVLRSVNLPVMTVGPEAHLAAESSNRERVVLHATTLREASRPSAALACQIAHTLKAKLVVLHVLPPIDEMERAALPTGLDSTALQQLNVLANENQCGCSAEIEPRVVHGNPAIEILSEAADRRACLIVLGATQRSALQELTRDRTIYKILAHARCPVLTLREQSVRSETESLAPMATHI